MLARSLFNMPASDLRKKSHLIVRILPETLGAAGISPAIDFVELCGSDLAADAIVGTNNRDSEKDRKFATLSFNSLSQALLSTASRQPLKRESHSLLTKVISQSLLTPTSKAVFCCSLSTNAERLRHSITALKFASKIREAIIKKCDRKTMSMSSTQQLQDRTRHGAKRVKEKIPKTKSKSSLMDMTA
jgi:hypothetical protein